jgi:hypothetical protein
MKIHAGRQSSGAEAWALQVEPELALREFAGVVDNSVAEQTEGPAVTNNKKSGPFSFGRMGRSPSQGY